MRIDELKANPLLLAQNQFFLKADNRNINYMIDQACALSIKGEEGDAKILSINNGDGDYYFPYINGVNNLGCVNISNEELKDGVIVTTPAMNGCALDVRYNPKLGYMFIHDNDSRNFDAINAQLPNHICVCRIDGNTYMNDMNYIHEMTAKYHPCIPAFQFVCVYKCGFWHVGLSEVYLRQENVVASFHRAVLGADVGVFNANVCFRTGGYDY